MMGPSHRGPAWAAATLLLSAVQQHAALAQQQQQDAGNRTITGKLHPKFIPSAGGSPFTLSANFLWYMTYSNGTQGTAVRLRFQSTSTGTVTTREVDGVLENWQNISCDSPDMGGYTGTMRVSYALKGQGDFGWYFIEVLSDPYLIPI